MLKNSFKSKLLNLNNPSKYNIGCSNLWRGLPLNILNKIIINSLSDFFIGPFEKYSDKKEFLFRSARSGIYAILKSQNIGEGDQVIVSTFTCDAVTFAVNATKAQIIYTDINDDLSMNYNSIINNINHKTKAILIQNSFGGNGINEENFKKLKKKGILIIEDNCLSIGTKINQLELNNFGDFSVESLESSKSITIGRGGIVKCNSDEYIKNFKAFYESLKSENLFNDILKIIQLWVNIFFSKYSIKYGFVIWYFFYGLRIFKPSRAENKKVKTKFIKIGKLSRILYLNLLPYKKHIFSNSNYVFKKILQNLKKHKAKIPIEYKSQDFIVTPRIPILVPEKNLKKILIIAKKNRIEISRWFYESPPCLNLSFNINKSNEKAQTIKNQIINLPSYCTNNRDIEKINKFIKLISPYIS